MFYFPLNTTFNADEVLCNEPIPNGSTTVSGIERDKMLEHPQKAHYGMLTTLLRLMLSNDEQSLKALSPMLVNSPNMQLDIDEHPSNALSPTLIALGTSTHRRLLQL